MGTPLYTIAALGERLTASGAFAHHRAEAHIFHTHWCVHRPSLQFKFAVAKSPSSARLSEGIRCLALNKITPPTATDRSVICSCR